MASETDICEIWTKWEITTWIVSLSLSLTYLLYIHATWGMNVNVIVRRELAFPGDLQNYWPCLNSYLCLWFSALKEVNGSGDLEIPTSRIFHLSQNEWLNLIIHEKLYWDQKPLFESLCLTSSPSMDTNRMGVSPIKEKLSLRLWALYRLIIIRDVMISIAAWKGL